MSYMQRTGSIWPCALALCAGLAAAACDMSSTPTQPNVVRAPVTSPAPVPGPVKEPPPGPPISVLAIKAVTLNGSAVEIAPTITLVETSGRGYAEVTSITFNLADGVPWPNPVHCGCLLTRVEAGGESTMVPDVDVYGNLGWSFSVPGDYTGRLEMVVSYEDEEGRKGGVSALVALPWVS